MACRCPSSAWASSSARPSRPSTQWTAIDAGYRLVDTASAYLNERAVGEGIRASGVDRAHIFVTTKIFPSQYG